jgi:hypothetical protein
MRALPIRRLLVYGRTQTRSGETMSISIQTDLLGKIIEVKPLGSDRCYITDYRDTERGPLKGKIRSIIVDASGFVILHIETEDGWIETRSTTSHKFRVIKNEPATHERPGSRKLLKHLRVGDVFKFVSPPPGWYTGKLVVLEQPPGWAMPDDYDWIVLSDMIQDEIGGEVVEMLDEKAPMPSGPSIPEEQ